MVANLTNTEFLALCRELFACDEGIKYLEQSGHDLATFWRTSDKPQWMLWLLANMIYIYGWPTLQDLVLVTCDCVEPTLKYIPAGEDRSRIAIETTRRWCRGEATIVEVREASKAAYVAADVLANAAHAARAVHATVFAMDYAARVAAYAAADAAARAADAIAYVAADAARVANALRAAKIDTFAFVAFAVADVNITNIIRRAIPLVED